MYNIIFIIYKRFMITFYQNIQSKYNIQHSSNNVTVELCIRLRELGFKFYTEFKRANCRFDLVVWSLDEQYIIACIEVKLHKKSKVDIYPNMYRNTKQKTKYLKQTSCDPLFYYADLLFCTSFEMVESVAQAVRAAQAKYERLKPKTIHTIT